MKRAVCGSNILHTCDLIITFRLHSRAVFQCMFRPKKVVMYLLANPVSSSVIAISFTRTS
jgi:hypothetical protein